MEEPENTVIETPTTEPDLNETITQTSSSQITHIFRIDPEHQL